MTTKQKRTANYWYKCGVGLSTIAQAFKLNRSELIKELKK